MALRYYSEKRKVEPVAPIPKLGGMSERQRVDAEIAAKLEARRKAKPAHDKAKPKTGFDALRSVLGEGYVPPPVKKKEK